MPVLWVQPAIPHRPDWREEQVVVPAEPRPLYWAGWIRCRGRLQSDSIRYPIREELESRRAPPARATPIRLCSALQDRGDGAGRSGGQCREGQTCFSSFRSIDAIASIEANDRWQTMFLLTQTKFPLPAIQMLSRRNSDAQAGRELRRIPCCARLPRRARITCLHQFNVNN